jgi:hypothetical protein
MNTYIHSYQYVPNSILKHIDLFCDKSLSEYYIINKKTSEKIIGLKNIPMDTSGIYKVFLSKLLNKKKSFSRTKHFASCNQINICIYVEIDFDKLYKYIKTYKTIPSRDNFFLLLKRNFLSEVNQDYSLTLTNINNFKLSNYNNKNSNFDPNIFIYKDMFFDYINCRFFLDENEYNLFQRKPNLPTKKDYLFYISDFDINGKLELLNKLKEKTLIICSQKKIQYWIKEQKGPYSVIDRLPFKKEVLNNKVIIIPSNLFYSSKYKNFFKSSISVSSADLYLNESIYNDFLLELISYNRDPINYESNILLHLLRWENIVLDIDLSNLKENKFLNEMIKLLNCNLFIYYFENKKTKMSFDDIRKMLNQILNINITYLNNYLIYKYQDHIFYNKSNKKYNQNVDIKLKELILGEKQIKFLKSLDLNNQIKYICFPNILKLERFKLIKNGDLSHENCSICLEPIKKSNLGVTSCNHTFCYSCIKRNLQNSLHCPNCRKKLSVNDIFHGINCASFTYLNGNNKLRDILNKTYDLILTKYETNKQILSTFLSDHEINNTIIGEGIQNKEDILIDDYENIENIENFKSIRNVLILEPLYSNDKYYKHKLRNICKNHKTLITQYNYKHNLVS